MCVCVCVCVCVCDGVRVYMCVMDRCGLGCNCKNNTDSKNTTLRGNVDSFTPSF